MRLLIESKRVVAIHLYTHPILNEYLLPLGIHVRLNFERESFLFRFDSTCLLLCRSSSSLPDETLDRVETRRSDSFVYSPSPYAEERMIGKHRPKW